MAYIATAGRSALAPIQKEFDPHPPDWIVAASFGARLALELNRGPPRHPDLPRRCESGPDHEVISLDVSEILSKMAKIDLCALFRNSEEQPHGVSPD